MAALIRWWIMFLLIMSAFVLAAVCDLFTMVWDGDVTKISFIVLLACLYGTIRIGKLTIKFANTIASKDHRLLDTLNIDKEIGWFTSSISSRIGLIGTVIGFIMMAMALAYFDSNNPGETIKTLSAGLSVALYTTLTGQVANILLAIQTFNLTQALEKELAKKPVQGYVRHETK